MKKQELLAAALIGALTLPGLSLSAMRTYDTRGQSGTSRAERVDTIQKTDWRGEGDVYRGERAAFTGSGEA